MKELAEFIKVTDKGLTKPVDEGDYDGLVECMGHLFAVKDRQASTDDMFEPLKQTIELLKTYEQEMPEEVHQQLQVYQGNVFVNMPMSKQFFLLLNDIRILSVYYIFASLSQKL